MKLVAIKSFTYAGERINPGNVFETKTDRDAKIMIGIKSARSVEGRREAKIPAPKKNLIEQASIKVDVVIPQVKEEIEVEKLEIKIDEAEKEEVENIEPEKEESKIEPEKEESKIASEKPEVFSNSNGNKRNYNKRK